MSLTVGIQTILPLRSFCWCFERTFTLDRSTTSEAAVSTLQSPFYICIGIPFPVVTESIITHAKKSYRNPRSRRTLQHVVHSANSGRSGSLTYQELARDTAGCTSQHNIL